MIDPKYLIATLKKNKINFFSGVADSTLKNFTSLLDSQKQIKHYPVYNEGSAVSLGIGHYLATKQLACIYLQNSGLSNCINPLISIAHKKVYSIPMLLIIGWRGSPNGPKDEPQHNIKGRITRDILKLLNIKNIVIRKKKDISKLKNLINFSIKKKEAVACLVENKTLKKNHIDKKLFKNNFNISREKAITELLKNIGKKTKIISTTGFTSREVFQLRKENNLKKGKDFYMIGGMGHSGMVSLGVSLSKNNQVVCLDGDGSIMMHFGSLKAQGLFGKKNFKHILLNNFCHESVGKQKTFLEELNFCKVSKNLGYKYSESVKDKSKLQKILKKFLKSDGPAFLEIKIRVGTLKNLERPKNFLKIKKAFMRG